MNVTGEIIHEKANRRQRVGGTHAENRLQQARINTGVTQEAAAETLSRGTCTLQRHETGKRTPNLAVLAEMKRCYNCEFSDLFPAELEFLGLF